MKIKILRANHPGKWYCGKIGEIFEAAPFSDTEFQTKENGYFIEKSDCVIVNEDGNARCCSVVWPRKFIFCPLCSKVLYQCSHENVSNTPDFILSKYIIDCLVAFESAIKKREKWGKKYNPKLADILCGALKLCQDGDFDLGYKIINDVIGQLRKNE